MQSIPVFPDITKIADFQRKNDDVGRTEKVVSRDLCTFWIFFR